MSSIFKTKITKSTDTDYPIHHLIEQRWSPRVFSETPIEKAHLKRLLEAARWAPSSNNGQPWRFIYANKGTKGYDKMYDCLGDFNQSWVDSPLLIITAYKKQFDNGKDNFHAPYDLGASIANMSVQAQSLGIALHQMAGVDFKKAAKVLNVPDEYHVTSAIAVGYYGGDINDLPEDLQKAEKGERKRMAQKEFAFKGGWK